MVLSLERVKWYNGGAPCTKPVGNDAKTVGRISYSTRVTSRRSRVHRKTSSVYIIQSSETTRPSRLHSLVQGTASSQGFDSTAEQERGAG